MKIPNYDPDFPATAWQQGYPSIPKDIFQGLICCPSNSGKTNIMLHMLYWLLEYDKVRLFSKNLHQNKYQVLLQDFAANVDPKVGYSVIEVFGDEIVPLEELPADNQKIVMFDDLVYAKNQNDITCFINDRHWNCTIIYLSQTFYKVPQNIHDNCSYFCLFRFLPRENKRIADELGVDPVLLDPTTDKKFSFKVPQAHMALKVLQAQQEPEARQERKDRKAIAGRQAHKEKKETKVTKERKVTKVMPAFVVWKARVARKVCEARKGSHGDYVKKDSSTAMTGNLDMGENLIQNVGYSKNILHVVNKSLLDSEIVGCLKIDGAKYSWADQEMGRHKLRNLKDIDSGLRAGDAVNKKYVDDSLQTKVDAIAQADLNMNNNVITNLAPPSAMNDGDGEQMIC